MLVEDKVLTAIFNTLRRLKYMSSLPFPAFIIDPDCLAMCGKNRSLSQIYENLLRLSGYWGIWYLWTYPCQEEPLISKSFLFRFMVIVPAIVVSLTLPLPPYAVPLRNLLMAYLELDGVAAGSTPGAVLLR